MRGRSAICCTGLNTTKGGLHEMICVSCRPRTDAKARHRRSLPVHQHRSERPRTVIAKFKRPKLGPHSSTSLDFGIQVNQYLKELDIAPPLTLPLGGELLIVHHQLATRCGVLSYPKLQQQQGSKAAAIAAHACRSRRCGRALLTLPGAS